jgi:hypothetical protein
MGYDAFVLTDAVRVGVPRAAMTIDARMLDILLARPRNADGRSQLQFDGELRSGARAGSDGFGSTIQLRGLSEILATGQTASPGMAAASVSADEISKFDAPRLLLNGSIYRQLWPGWPFRRNHGRLWRYHPAQRCASFSG